MIIGRPVLILSVLLVISSCSGAIKNVQTGEEIDNAVLWAIAWDLASPDVEVNKAALKKLDETLGIELSIPFGKGYDALMLFLKAQKALRDRTIPRDLRTKEAVNWYQIYNGNNYSP